ncbi:MAG: beta-propeller fold lactonase family protein [Casimicrobiaceae bacterium]
MRLASLTFVLALVVAGLAAYPGPLRAQKPPLTDPEKNWILDVVGAFGLSLAWAVLFPNDPPDSPEAADKKSAASRVTPHPAPPGKSPAASPLVPKAAADYGALTPIAGAANSNCSHSDGAAFHPSGRYVYFTGGIGSPGRLCGYSVDPVTGAFTPIAEPPVATGALPNAVVFEPSGKFIYVVGGASNNVSGYAVERTTGKPVPVAGSPFATNGTTPVAMVVDNAGRFAYVANYRGTGSSPGTFTGSVAVFALNQTTGALSHIAGSPFEMDRAFNDSATSLALTPDGRFLFVGGIGLTTFSVNPVTGALTHITERGPLFTGGVAVDPTGHYLYVPDASIYVVHGFAIASDGALTPTGTQPIGTPDANSTTRGITILGDLVYVANTPAKRIYGFRIQQATGALAAVSGSPFATDARSFALAAQGFLASSMQVEAGDSVIATLGAFGGQPPYAWSITYGVLPPGLTLNAKTGIVAGTATASGAYTFTVQAADSANATASHAKTILVGGALYTSVPVVEFYHAGLDHYFVTWVADEIAKLDAGIVIKGWTRTGKGFRTYASALEGTSPVCRYYIPPTLGNSHYYGRGTAECDDTGRKNPTFVLEDASFMHMVLPTGGLCPSSTLPVYRVFSNRPDANHRYTTERAVRDSMVAKGWVAEGDGPDLVVMCGAP